MLLSQACKRQATEEDAPNQLPQASCVEDLHGSATMPPPHSLPPWLQSYSHWQEVSDTLRQARHNDMEQARYTIHTSKRKSYLPFAPPDTLGWPS